MSMGKAFGIAVMVVGLWVGIEIYTEGMSGAFGGFFRNFGTAEASVDPAQTDKPLDALRLGVGHDMDVAEAKRKRAMGEAP
jgi:hypothetical protein